MKAQKKAQSQIKAMSTLEVESAKDEKESNEILKRLKKEMEKFAKFKSQRHKKEKNEQNVDLSMLEIIRKNSDSKYLPKDINRKLNEF